MKRFRRSACVLVFCCVVSRAVAEEEASVKPLFPIGLDHEFKQAAATFEQVKKLILDHYYTDAITEDALYWAAIKGMLQHVSPPEKKDLCTIFTPDQYQRVSDSLKGVQVSIGVRSTFNPVDGSVTVAEVIKDSPADSLLQPLDRIMRIDGKSLKGLQASDIDNLLLGDEDTSVSLTVVRDIHPFELTLKRKPYRMPNLTVDVLQDQIGFVQIENITAGVSDELKAALQKLREQGVGKLILDLRNNSGGVFIEALKIVELFLPEKHILARIATRENKVQNYVSSNKEPFSFRLAILVNGKTASSSEIVAGSLQTHQKAVIVGTHIYGKSVFEKTYDLENECRVKFIIGALYTPQGASWQSRGILPDFAAEQDENALTAAKKLSAKDRLTKDLPLLTAFKLLK